jgi:hypothetical protein
MPFLPQTPEMTSAKAASPAEVLLPTSFHRGTEAFETGFHLDLSGI